MLDSLPIQAVAQKDVQSAVAQYQADKSELAGLRERLEILGLSSSAIANLQKSQELVRALPVSAHLAGIVMSRNAVAGSPVNTSNPIFEIDNLDTVWVEGNVFESQLAGIRPGLPTAVTVPAYPGRVFEGRVQNVIPMLNPTTRTAHLRVVLRNPDDLLKPGMFATLMVTVGTDAPGLAVPNAALFKQGGSDVVFVKKGERFVMLNVVVSARDGQYSQISQGLAPNDVVVTQGKMQIYAKFSNQINSQG